MSGIGVDDADVTLFRRADISADVVRAVIDLQEGPTGTASEGSRGRSRPHVGSHLPQGLERFHGPATSRALQVIAGRRPDMTGIFSFRVRLTSLNRLRASADGWVALVPVEGELFLLAPVRSFEWRSLGAERVHATVLFDLAGRPTDLPSGVTVLKLPEP